MRKASSNDDRRTLGLKIFLSFALMFILVSATISNMFIYAEGQNSATSSQGSDAGQSTSNSTSTSNEASSDSNSTTSEPSNSDDANVQSNSTSEAYSNSTSTENSSQNSTATSSGDTTVEQSQPVSNVTASESPPSASETVQSVTISGEPMLPAAGSISRSFSYPALLFEGDTVAEVEATMTWNPDGTTVIKDNRGNELTLAVPKSQGNVTLYANSTTVDQRIDGSDAEYSIYWFPAENSRGYVDRYEFILAGTSENASSLVLDILDSAVLPYAVSDGETLAIGDVDANDLEDSDNRVSDANTEGLLLDWSDAIKSGIDVHYDSAKSELIIPVEENSDFFVDPYIVASTNWSISPDKALAFQDQLRLVATSNETVSRINAFYYDGSNIVFKTSDDNGDSWGSANSLGTGALASNIQRWSIATSTSIEGDDYVHVFYWTKSGTTTTVKTIRGTIDGLNLTWDSPIQIFDILNNESCAPGACVGVSAASDADGNIYAAFSWNTTSGSFPMVIKESFNNGETWIDSMPQVNNTATNVMGMTLTPLEEPQMLLVYGKGESANLFYRLFNGTVWGSEQVITGTDLQQWTRKQISSIYHDGDGKAYIAYTNVTTTTGGKLKVARFSSNGTFDGLETIDDTLRHFLPNIIIGENGDISIVTIANGMIYDTRRFAGAWESPFNPFGTTFVSPDDLTAAAVMNGVTAAIWKEGSNTPYNIVFDLLPVGRIEAASTAQLSPEDTDYYEGEKRVLSSTDNTLYAFYYDGSNIVYKVSNDLGHSWSSIPVSAGTGAVSSDAFRWSIAHTKSPGAERIALLYYKTSGSNTDFYAKTYLVDNQTLYLVGTSSLFTIANDASCNPGVCALASGASDDNGTMFAAFSYKSASTWYTRVMKSNNGGQTWTTSLGQTSISASNRLVLTITSLDAGKMLLAWAKHESSSLFYKEFDGSSWGSTTTLSGIGWSANTIKQISSGTVPPLLDNVSRAYVAYVSSGNSGSLKLASFYGNGTFISAETADDTLSHTLPSITTNTDGLLHVYTLVGGQKIYETTRNETSWLSPVSRYDSYLEHPSQLTSLLGGVLNGGAVWSDGYSPFEIRYGGTVGGTYFSTSQSQSPSASSSYDGEKRVVRTPDAIFAFYYSLTGDIKYRVSTNSGSTWGSSLSASTGLLAKYDYKWTLAATEISGTKYITLLYFKNSGTGGEDTTFYAKRGTVSGTSISWGSQVSLFTVDNTCATCGNAQAAAVAATASNGYIYAAFQYEDDVDHDTYYRIMRSTNGGSTWSTSLSATSAAEDADTLTMALARLASGKMLFVWLREDSSLIRYRVFDGSVWSSMSSIGSSTTGLSAGPNKQATADSDSSGKPYLVYLKGGNSGELRVASWNNGGGSPTVEIVDSSMSHRLPSVTIRPDNNLINIYSLSFGPNSIDDARSLYLVYKLGGEWVAPHKPYQDSSVDIKSLTVGWGLGGAYAPVTWTEPIVGSTSLKIRTMGLFKIDVRVIPLNCDHAAQLSNKCVLTGSFGSVTGTYRYVAPTTFVQSTGLPCEGAPKTPTYSSQFKISFPQFPKSNNGLPLAFVHGTQSGSIPVWRGVFDRIVRDFTPSDIAPDTVFSPISGNVKAEPNIHCIIVDDTVHYFVILYYSNGFQWRVGADWVHLSFGYKP